MDFLSKKCYKKTLFFSVVATQTAVSGTMQAVCQAHASDRRRVRELPHLQKMNTRRPDRCAFTAVSSPDGVPPREYKL